MLGSLPFKKTAEFAAAYRRNGDLSPLPTDSNAQIKELKVRVGRVMPAMIELGLDSAETAVRHVQLYECKFGSLHTGSAEPVCVVLRPPERCCTRPDCHDKALQVAVEKPFLPSSCVTTGCNMRCLDTGGASMLCRSLVPASLPRPLRVLFAR